MPKTKTQAFIFTLIMAAAMVYCMTLYNISLSAGDMKNIYFLYALKGMWFEYVIIFLCAFFISSPLAQKLAFRIVSHEDKPIFIIVSIQIFTVILQVALASIIGVHKSFGFTSNFIADYIVVYCRNFLMAMPLQVFFVGPAVRFIFRHIF